MYNINHNDALKLERIVRELYKCERYGVVGLVDADNFESNPLEAMVLVIAYLYANNLIKDKYDEEYKKFYNDYHTIFNYHKGLDMKKEVEKYINKLEEIKNKYI